MSALDRLDLLQAYVERLPFFDVPLRHADGGHERCPTCAVCCVVPALRPVEPADLIRLAQGLGLPESEVRSRYLRAYGELTSLGAPCALLVHEPKAGRWLCSVYEHRPEVCRRFNRCAVVQLDPADAEACITAEQVRFARYYSEVREA